MKWHDRNKSGVGTLESTRTKRGRCRNFREHKWKDRERGSYHHCVGHSDVSVVSVGIASMFRGLPSKLVVGKLFVL